tara:strand:- start:1384 stop:1572 length:189 start_codon:yes stop_codon:yes gene_type:complete
MTSKILTFQPDALNLMCAVCASDRSGGQIALMIIVFTLIALAAGNWAWKKYFKNTKEISTEK